MNKLVPFSFVGLFVLGACGKSVNLEDRPCPCTSGWTCCDGICLEGGSCPAPPAGGFARSAVSVAKAACGGSGQAPVAATSAADATSKLGHAWVPCNRFRWLEDREGEGIGFSNDGTWTLFELDPQGGLAPKTGLGSHGTWAVYGNSSSPLDRTDTSTKQITVVSFADQGSAGNLQTALLAFEPGSGRLRLSKPNASPPQEIWLAPLAGGWDPTIGCGSACSPAASGIDGGL